MKKRIKHLYVVTLFITVHMFILFILLKRLQDETETEVEVLNNNEDFGFIMDIPSENEPNKEYRRQYYVLPKSFLNEIGKYEISQQNACGSNSGEQLPVVLIVVSAAGNFKARNAIRETWGGDAVKKGAAVLFLLAKSMDFVIQKKIYQENTLYKDIIQASFIDHYNNLTLKTVTVMKWVNRYCYKAKFVHKLDDDTFVNSEALVDYCKNLKAPKSIIGYVFDQAPVYRNSSKWSIPKSVISEDNYPRYTIGQSYLVSGDAISLLLTESYNTKAFFIEDIFLTGYVAAKVNITHRHNIKFLPIPLPVTKCSYSMFLTMAEVSASEMRVLWENAHNKNCPQIASQIVGLFQTMSNT